MLHGRPQAQGCGIAGGTRDWVGWEGLALEPPEGVWPALALISGENKFLLS